MARHPLTRLLQQVFAETLQETRSPGTPMDNGRRKFLQQSLSIAGGALLIPPSISSLYDEPTAGRHDRVAIIGAGIAGLHAAWLLKNKGIHASVYEASARPGGRMFTKKDFFGDGLSTDIGGEFVDKSHTDIIQLTNSFGLELIDLRTDRLIPKTFWFGNRLLGEEDLRQAIRPYIDRLETDIKSLPAIIDHTTASQFKRLDEQSITDYLHSAGISGWLFAFLDMVLTREYGMQASEQSAINFLIMFEPPSETAPDYELFGQDHEIFKIKGGSQRLTDKLYAELKPQVIFNHRLQAIRPNTSGGVNLHFGETPKAPSVVQADHVIMAIPFSTLRQVTIDLPMPAEKKKCIQEMGYGKSCKFIMGMKDRPWRIAKRQGYCFTDLSFGCGWDSSQLQPGNKGSFTVFGGGDFADQVRDSTEESLSKQFLPALDSIYPGSANAYTGRNLKYSWAANPNNRGGYSSFKKGQWSTLAGWEATPVGPLLFAGEHVSREFQGYMNGAAQTGRIAAETLIGILQQQPNNKNGKSAIHP